MADHGIHVGSIVTGLLWSEPLADGKASVPVPASVS